MEEKPHIRSVIASNIKKYRKLNNLTQEALAEKAEISNTYIANIECGQTWVSDKTLEKIASALHTEIYLLFIPETNEASQIDAQKEYQQTVSYLAMRQDELCDYVKGFFSETFSKVTGRLK